MNDRCDLSHIGRARPESTTHISFNHLHPTELLTEVQVDPFQGPATLGKLIDIL